jgi:hypothetical protein
MKVPWLYCLIKYVNCISSHSVNDSTDSVFVSASVTAGYASVGPWW